MLLTDEQWAMLEPLVEACRPPAKVPPRNLRRTISAIFWRHRNGAKWRAIPEEFGPWWMAAQIFIRWSLVQTAAQSDREGAQVLSALPPPCG